MLLRDVHPSGGTTLPVRHRIPGEIDRRILMRVKRQPLPRRATCTSGRRLVFRCPAPLATGPARAGPPRCAARTTELAAGDMTYLFHWGHRRLRPLGLRARPGRGDVRLRHARATHRPPSSTTPRSSRSQARATVSRRGHWRPGSSSDSGPSGPPPEMRHQPPGAHLVPDPGALFGPYLANAWVATRSWTWTSRESAGPDCYSFAEAAA